MKFALLLGAAVVLTSCSNGIKGSGDIQEKEIRLEQPIKELKLEGNFFAVLIQSEERKILIEAQQNLLSNVVIDAKDDELYISEKKSAHTDEIYKIYIYSNTLESIDLSDNVEFDVSGELRTNEFSADLHDNSKWLSQVFIENLDLEAKQNSSVNLKGTCTNFEATLEDNANFLSPDFIISSADIDISDNVQMNVQIMSELEGSSSGNSVLEYRGNPNKDFQEKDQSKLLKTE